MKNKENRIPIQENRINDDRLRSKVNENLRRLRRKASINMEYRLDELEMLLDCRSNMGLEKFLMSNPYITFKKTAPNKYTVLSFNDKQK